MKQTPRMLVRGLLLVIIGTAPGTLRDNVFLCHQAHLQDDAALSESKNSLEDLQSLFIIEDITIQPEDDSHRIARRDGVRHQQTDWATSNYNASGSSASLPPVQIRTTSNGVVVPEPASLTVLGAGVLALMYHRCRKKT